MRTLVAGIGLRFQSRSPHHALTTSCFPALQHKAWIHSSLRIPLHGEPKSVQKAVNLSEQTTFDPQKSQEPKASFDPLDFAVNQYIKALIDAHEDPFFVSRWYSLIKAFRKVRKTHTDPKLQRSSVKAMTAKYLAYKYLKPVHDLQRRCALVMLRLNRQLKQEKEGSWRIQVTTENPDGHSAFAVHSLNLIVIAIKQVRL